MSLERIFWMLSLSNRHFMDYVTMVLVLHETVQNLPLVSNKFHEKTSSIPPVQLGDSCQYNILFASINIAPFTKETEPSQSS